MSVGAHALDSGGGARIQPKAQMHGSNQQKLTGLVVAEPTSAQSMHVLAYIQLAKAAARVRGEAGRRQLERAACALRGAAGKCSS